MEVLEVGVGVGGRDALMDAGVRFGMHLGTSLEVAHQHTCECFSFFSFLKCLF